MTLPEITKALESAVYAVEVKKKAADEAKSASDKAAAAFAESRAKVKDLHDEYLKLMSAVLSGFGQIHK